VERGRQAPGTGVACKGEGRRLWIRGGMHDGTRGGGQDRRSGTRKLMCAPFQSSTRVSETVCTVYWHWFPWAHRIASCEL
jgi:hypothetical protein